VRSRSDSFLTQSTVAPELADKAQKLSAEISDAIYAHGVVNHPKYGKMFAYEVPPTFHISAHRPATPQRLIRTRCARARACRWTASATRI
jgi:hypothetical protein